MTDQNENIRGTPGDEKPVPPPPLVSRIIIVFAEPDSVRLNISYENVSPLQVQAAGFLLEQGAIENIAAMQRDQREKAALSKITVPGQGLGGMPRQ